MLSRDLLPAPAWRLCTTLIFCLSLAVTHVSMAHAEQKSLGGGLTELLQSLTGGANTSQGPKYQATRLVVELERSAKFEVFSLVNPNRVVIEIPNMRMRLPDVRNGGPGNLVTDVRHGISAPGKARVVVSVAAPVVVIATRLARGPSGGTDLQIDLAPARASNAVESRPDFKMRAASLGAGGLQPPVPRSADKPGHLRKRDGKYVIVIDPGHGGHDSGAKKFGVLEKNAVLSVSQLLRDKLEATGRYKVLMTRDRDVFVTLGNRRKFAERHDAALYISVHADYARRSGARGATIYSLRKRVAQRLKKSAKRREARSAHLTRNQIRTIKATASNARSVQGILSDLAQRDVEWTDGQTRSFTQTVIKHMGQSTDMRSRPHRSAAFKVLKTATMPAVLIELAYVSNRRDARRLKSRSWQNKVSGSIATAVDNYFLDVSRLPL